MNMVEIAKQFLGANHLVKQILINYYNDNCIGLVKPNRRYRMKVTDQWCAMFTSVIAHKAGLSSNSFPYEVSVYYQTLLAKERGLFYTDRKLLKPNDLIIYDWDRNGTLDHVGIVVQVSNNHVIKVIEGNYNDTVQYRTINYNHPIIYGFIDTLSKPVSNVEKLPKTVNPDKYETRITMFVNAVLRGELGSGSERKSLLGSDYEEVQKRINKLFNN